MDDPIEEILRATDSLKDVLDDTLADVKEKLKYLIRNNTGKSWLSDSMQTIHRLGAVQDILQNSEKDIAELRVLIKDVSSHVRYLSDIDTQLSSNVSQTPGAIVAELVTKYINSGAVEIDTQALLDNMEAKGSKLPVQNPAAVVSSILGRDSRLEKDERRRGIFKVR